VSPHPARVREPGRRHADTSLAITTIAHALVYHAPSMTLPTRQVVIIGGGVVGCSIAYHLAGRGMRDVVVLERERCSGTTRRPPAASAQFPTETEIRSREAIKVFRAFETVRRRHRLQKIGTCSSSAIPPTCAARARPAAAGLAS